jgi:hypothetical protein
METSSPYIAATKKLELLKNVDILSFFLNSTTAPAITAPIFRTFPKMLKNVFGNSFFFISPNLFLNLLSLNYVSFHTTSPMKSHDVIQRLIQVVLNVNKSTFKINYYQSNCKTQTLSFDFFKPQQ